MPNILGRFSAARVSQTVNDIADGSINLSEALGTRSFFTNVIKREEDEKSRDGQRNEVRCLHHDIDGMDLTYNVKQRMLANSVEVVAIGNPKNDIAYGTHILTLVGGWSVEPKTQSLYPTGAPSYLDGEMRSYLR